MGSSRVILIGWKTVWNLEQNDEILEKLKQSFEVCEEYSLDTIEGNIVNRCIVDWQFC